MPGHMEVVPALATTLLQLLLPGRESIAIESIAIGYALTLLLGPSRWPLRHAEPRWPSLSGWRGRVYKLGEGLSKVSRGWLGIMAI